MKGTTQKEKYRRCCGMDVHKETVVVCVLAPDGEEGKALKKVLWHVPQRSRADAWMAEAVEGDRDCDGIHWGLLETSVECLGGP